VEILGGLVKTLHPGIHAGILADRSNPAHLKELASLGYTKIDMVVVNFYAIPGAKPERDLSFIDIGGPAMARAAAKNFRSCVPVPDPSWYEKVLAEIEPGGDVGEDLRWTLAVDALRRTGTYDARVLDALGLGVDAAPEAESVLLGLKRSIDLRYGENPHQKAAFYAAAPAHGLEILKGELSYNNILDVDCCVEILREFGGKAAVVIKHVCPCGAAEGEVGCEVLDWAYGCDPVSAFGGVIWVSFRFDAACAELVAKRFVECVVAPEFDEAALGMLARKKARLVRFFPGRGRAVGLRSALHGVLLQARDDVLLREDLRFVSGEPPAGAVLEDLVFAWKVAKHVKSNAIVFAKDRRTLGIGAGQPSRVDATRLAIAKAREFGHDLKGSVMASDGFFPFPDSVELSGEAGAVAVIQPGGSIRDGEVIEAARRLGLVMALTSIRHFRH
jgi:phosphoribosylaminoimidazolecarboxamide formyltransferase/IMP cyclohydrolase